MNPFGWVRKRLKTRGLLLALALISMIGFSLNALSVYLGQTIPVVLAYPSIILGIGLLFESRAIDKFVFKDRREVFDLPKVITFIIGLVVLFGGLVSSQVFGLTLTPEVLGAVGLANIIAIGVIVYEIFLIE